MGVYLSQPDTRKSTEEGSFKNLKYVACSMQGWRTNMEDAHIMDGNIAEDTAIFGVFDGHGGKEVAIFVAKHFIPNLKQNPNFQQQKFQEALFENFLKMDELLQTEDGKKELAEIKSGSSKADYQTESFAGCTANVSLIYKNKIICANAGDSRSVLCRSGSPFPLSEDHKPDQQKERDRVTKAGGFISEGRINGNLNLSRAIGDLEYKKGDLKVDEQLIIACPDFQETEINPETDSYLLMGCDGIWEMKPTEQLVTKIQEDIDTKDLKNIIEEMLDSVIAPDTANGYGCDNMTALIINLKGYK